MQDNAAAAANADDDADAQDAEGEADAGAGDAGPPDHENVNSKADLNLLRAQYAHTDAMIEDFMHDHELHLKVRILVFTGRELQLEYAQGLERHKPGQTSMLEWQAAHEAVANGSTPFAASMICWAGRTSSRHLTCAPVVTNLWQKINLGFSKT